MLTLAILVAAALLTAFEVVVYGYRRKLVPPFYLLWAAAFSLAVMVGFVVRAVGSS